jgi:hypothetical protein
MNETILFSTDTATLAIFDPAILAKRVADTGDWWCGSFHAVPEVASGRIALFGLGADGVYKVRITSHDLTSAESSYATEVITLGIEVESGRVFIGAGECIPSGGVSPEPSIETGRSFLAVPPGQYTVAGYAVKWQDAPDWFTGVDEPVSTFAPADLVLRFTPRVEPFVAPNANPRFFLGVEEQWLFPEQPRRLGPVPGMILSTSVALRRDDLVLKPCGPRGYRPIVEDMSRLRWRDRIQVRVLSVNHLAREFAAEVVVVGS